MKVTNMGRADVREGPGVQRSSEILGQHPALAVYIGTYLNFAFQHIYNMDLAY